GCSALLEAGSGSAGLGGGWCHVDEAFVVTSVVIMLAEGFDMGLRVTGQEVIFEQDAILEGLMPALDLALGLGMHRSAAHMAHFPALDIFRQFTRDVARAIIRQRSEARRV